MMPLKKTRLPDRPTHKQRDFLTLAHELTTLHSRFYQHQWHNAAAFFQDYSDDLRKARRPLHASDPASYLIDAWQRMILFWDVMRERGNRFIEHQAAGNPPVIKFEYETVLDGRTFEHPVNFSLTRILPPEGVTIDPKKRPFVIVDPRAGHGPGIGGFKQESQVGVALQAGHPVYFVVFGMDPVPGQTLHHVAEAETEFLRYVARAHPDSNKPCVLGNCQGGWAVMAVAAAHPELTGPLVLSGAPLSYWAGATGKNPTRYLGGLIGGAWLATMLSDLGHGTFDGANLVANFESLDLANTYWSKYYQLYANIDRERERFLDFERWWGGYSFMTTEEMRAILGNLFIGNKLSRGEIAVSRDMYLDLRRIEQPIVIFCSTGDNITPPQQALNWIADLYEDERAIKASGQVIVYMIHATTGHLGIFVSGSIIQREHQEITATLEAIESLPPGLYEMIIVDEGREGAPKLDMRIEERSIAQLLEQGGTQMQEEAEFEIVKLISEFNATAYEMFASPLIRKIGTPMVREWIKTFHPLRVQHWGISDLNPFLLPLPALAAYVRSRRHVSAGDNPLHLLEAAQSKLIEYGYDTLRDWRDIGSETLFYLVYGSLAASGFGGRLLAARHPQASEEDRMRREALVKTITDTAAVGDFVDAILRIFLLLAQGRRHFTRSEIGVMQEKLSAYPEFSGLNPDERRARMRRQTVIVAYQPQAALSTLPALLPDAEARKRALQLMRKMDGIEADSPPEAREIWQKLEAMLLA